MQTAPRFGAEKLWRSREDALFTPVGVSRRCASTRRSGRRASGGRRSSSSSRRCCPRCRRSSRTRAASTGTQPLCARASPRGTATRFGYSRSRRAQWGGPLESVGEPSAREPARESAPRSSAPAIELGAKMHHLRRLRNEVTLRYLCHVRYACDRPTVTGRNQLLGV